MKAKGGKIKMKLLRLTLDGQQKEGIRKKWHSVKQMSVK